MNTLNGQLETYIIIPFEIRNASINNLHINRVDFQQKLIENNWQKLNGHDLDPISIQYLSEDQKKHIRYQAYNYFHPFVRGFWFDRNLVQRFRRSDISTLSAQVYNGKENVEVVFDAVCDLLHFTPDIGVLSLHLKAKSTYELKTIQASLDQIRRLYAPYIGSGDGQIFGGHFPKKVRLINYTGRTICEYTPAQLGEFCELVKDIEATDSNVESHIHIWAKHWQHLLNPIQTERGSTCGYQALQLGDDRAALVSWLAVSRNADGVPLPKLVSQGDMFRICFADGPGDTRSPYSELYMADFEKRFCYDRFWFLQGESYYSPSRILNCGYAFTWLGDLTDDGYFNEQATGAPPTFRHIYTPMAIIAQFQKAKLLVTARKLADLSSYNKYGAKAKLDKKTFQEIQYDFISFTQTYWFEEITPQEQGVELFDMWSRELRLRSTYESTRQQLQDIVGYIETNNTSYLNNLVATLTIFSLIFTALSLYSSLLGMNNIDIKQKIEITNVDIPNWFAQNAGLISLTLAASALLFVLFYYIIPNIILPFFRRSK